MKERSILFEEKQYLGLNKYSIYRRSLLAGFCLLIYFSSEYTKKISVKEHTEDFLLILAVILLAFSILLLFVLHLHTTVYEKSIELRGFWTARLVKIPLESIVSVKKIKYSRYFFNRPVYNLHNHGTIKFFTRGNNAIELKDRDGTSFIIGSQRPDELESVLNKALENVPTLN